MATEDEKAALMSGALMPMNPMQGAPRASFGDFFGVGDQSRHMASQGYSDPRAAAWGQALSNIAMMNMGQGIRQDPGAAAVDVRAQNARLTEMRERGLQERQRWAEQASYRELQKQKMQRDLDPMADFHSVIEALGLQDRPIEAQLAGYSQFNSAGNRGFDPGRESKTMAQWRQLNPRGQNETEDAYKARQAVVLNSVINRPMVYDTGAGGKSLHDVTGNTTINTLVTPEAAMAMNAASEAANTTANILATDSTDKQVAAPKAIRSATYGRDIVRKALAHPGLSASTGRGSVLNDYAIPGSDRANFLTLSAQLKGQAFMKAYQDLKGGGTITEIEGAKAEAAQSRLNLAQTEEAFRDALAEMDGLFTEEIARQEAFLSGGNSTGKPGNQIDIPGLTPRGVK